MRNHYSPSFVFKPKIFNSLGGIIMRELKISAKMLIVERDMCISYDSIYGSLYKEIYEKAPSIFKEVTGDEFYISECERAQRRWELEAELMGVDDEQKRTAIRGENGILYRGINNYHPELADSIIIMGG